VNPADVLVRIGLKKPGNANTTDAQLISRGDIQTREAFTITKNPSNSSANDELIASSLVGNGVAESRIEQSADGKGMIFEQTTANGG